jgi:hypothetical protein
VLNHNPKDINLVGIPDKAAVESTLRILAIRDMELIVKINSPIYNATFGRIQGVEDMVTVQLPKRELGMISRIGITKGPIFLILRETTDIMKQGRYKSKATIVLSKAKTGRNTISDRAYPVGVFLFDIKVSLVQGVGFPKGEHELSKPIMEKMILLIIHVEILCLNQEKVA